MGSSPPAETATPDAAASLSIAGVDPERNFAGGETQVLGLTRRSPCRPYRKF